MLVSPATLSRRYISRITVMWVQVDTPRWLTDGTQQGHEQDSSTHRAISLSHSAICSITFVADEQPERVIRRKATDLSQPNPNVLKRLLKTASTPSIPYQAIGYNRTHGERKVAGAKGRGKRRRLWRESMTQSHSGYGTEAT